VGSYRSEIHINLTIDGEVVDAVPFPILLRPRFNSAERKQTDLIVGKVGVAVLRVKKIWTFVILISLTTQRPAGDFTLRCLGHVGLILILLEGNSPAADPPNTTQPQKQRTSPANTNLCLPSYKDLEHRMSWAQS
jgi:hypothetical protein